MATVHWPGNEVARVPKRAHLIGVPFIMTGDEEFPDGINAFIFERARGKVSALHGAAPRVRLRPLDREARRKIAYNLADLLTWGETERAHPTQGTIRWDQLKSWHILEMYQDALIRGYWSENFFRTKSPSPIAPETVRTKISHALGCFKWMADNGFVTNFDYEPALQTITLSKDACLLSYRRELQQAVTNSVPVAARAFRKSPGNQPLPTLPHLHAFFSALAPGPHRLIALQMFETGMPATEVIANTLIPGRVHQRCMDRSKWHVHPSWSDQPLTLEWSLGDDRMIGVIPPLEMVEWKLKPGSGWDRQSTPGSRLDYGYQCNYRIIGKGPKVRLAHLPPKLLLAMWAYINGARRSNEDSAHVYLNRFQQKMSYHAIWEAFDAANHAIKSPLRLTPHVMRHAYACYFLEAAIIKEGQDRGYDRNSIPPELILEHGSRIRPTIQSDLGHSEAKSTKKYLEQVAKGWIRMSAHQTWNQFLDEVQLDV